MSRARCYVVRYYRAPGVSRCLAVYPGSYEMGGVLGAVARMMDRGGCVYATIRCVLESEGE